MPAHMVPSWWVGWWLWSAGCISQDTYLLYFDLMQGILFDIYHLGAFDSQAKAVLVGCIYNQASLSPPPPVIKQLCWHQRKMHHLASSRPSDMNRWTFTQLLNFASPSQPLPRGSSKDKMPFNKWFCTSLKWWIVRQTSWKCPDCMKWWDLEQESQKFPAWQNIV